MSDSQPAIYSILWACASSWYYGYHLSELNFPVTSLTCLSPAFPPPSRLPLCIGIDANLYGLVTAIFTVGGLVGSLGSSWVVQKEGVKGGILWSGYLNVVGVLGMGIAPHWIILASGRFVVGVSAGIAICLVPPFLSLIARSSPELSARAGQVGTLHQMGIVIGLFSAQAAGMFFTGSKGDIPGKWRYIVAISGIISAIQIAVAPRVFTPGSEQSRKPSIVSDVDGGGLSPVPNHEGQLLVSSPVTSLMYHLGRLAASSLLPDHAQSPEAQLPLRELLSNTSLRGPTLLCASILCLQQLSGVNAVMFYSTPVLRPIMPASAGSIGLQITFVNALMTVAAIFLIERVGRKGLLLASIGGMTVTSALLAWGLDHQYGILSAAAIILFIASFSIGLGPVPFLLVSEVVPSPAITALASLSLSLNWVANFFIAILFLPLRDALSSPIDPGDPISARKGEGRVFYLFTAVCIILGLLVWRGLGTAR